MDIKNYVKFENGTHYMDGDDYVTAEFKSIPDVTGFGSNEQEAFEDLVRRLYDYVKLSRNIHSQVISTLGV